jgi:protein SCO1/2
MRRSLRLLVPLLLLAVVASACGGGGSSASTATTATSDPDTATTSSGFAAPLAPEKPLPAPNFTLKNQFGQPISLKQYRGKAVLLTFVYVHCPDVCPLISAALRTTLDKLGPEAKKVAVVEISVDPVGDTVPAVTKYLSERGVLHKFQYLVGTRKQLAPVWAKYHIQQVPDEKLHRLIGHTGIVFGIDATGKVRTYYPSQPIKPAWMIHDVPLLAA